MNTDTPVKKVLSSSLPASERPKGLTPEQKARKNELARLRRANNKKNKEDDDTENSVPVPELEYKTDEEETPVAVAEPTEDPVLVRKREIAEKRRASLALARSKIKSKTEIKQEKDDEINRIKEENERLKQEAEKARLINAEKPKVIKKIIKEKKRSSNGSHHPQPKEASIEYLTQQTYAEQLRLKLRENMLNNIMMDTFM